MGKGKNLLPFNSWEKERDQTWKGKTCSSKWQVGKIICFNAEVQINSAMRRLLRMAICTWRHMTWAGTIICFYYLKYSFLNLWPLFLCNKACLFTEFQFRILSPANCGTDHKESWCKCLHPHSKSAHALLMQRTKIWKVPEHSVLLKIQKWKPNFGIFLMS